MSPELAEVSDVVRLILPVSGSKGEIGRSMITAFLTKDKGVIDRVHREDNVSPDRIKSFTSDTVLYVDKTNHNYREYLAGRRTSGELIRAILTNRE